jgi:hypothetical protein
LSRWPRIGGLRVVMSWPDSQFAPAPAGPGRARIRLAGIAGTALLLGGAATIGVAVLAQQHAPAPAASAAGTVGPIAPKEPSLPRSAPVSVAIPAIGVRSPLLRLGLNPDGTMQVDSRVGPAVFFRLGALRPGDHIDVTLGDGMTAVFRVTGVREYTKSDFPTQMIYGPTKYAALRLVTCGGTFDYATGHYLSSVVVFASLVSPGRSVMG